MTPVVLQDFYDHQRLWAWTPSQARPIARADVEGPGSAPLRTPYRAAMLGGCLAGVRPSPEGVVLFVGDEAQLLDPATDALHVVRDDRLVRVELRRRSREGASLVRLSFAYAPSPAELDTWEGRACGLFDWLAERLERPGFDASFGLAAKG